MLLFLLLLFIQVRPSFNTSFDNDNKPLYDDICDARMITKKKIQ